MCVWCVWYGLWRVLGGVSRGMSGSLVFGGSLKQCAITAARDSNRSITQFVLADSGKPFPAGQPLIAES